jgi:hypothetical protein
MDARATTLSLRRRFPPPRRLGRGPSGARRAHRPLSRPLPGPAPRSSPSESLRRPRLAVTPYVRLSPTTSCDTLSARRASTVRHGPARARRVIARDRGRAARHPSHRPPGARCTLLGTAAGTPRASLTGYLGGLVDARSSGTLLIERPCRLAALITCGAAGARRAPAPSTPHGARVVGLVFTPLVARTDGPRCSPSATRLRRGRPNSAGEGAFIRECSPRYLPNVCCRPFWSMGTVRPRLRHLHRALASPSAWRSASAARPRLGPHHLRELYASITGAGSGGRSP